MRRIIAVIDSDIKYAARLADYINSHGTGSLKAVAYSCIETARADRNHEISAAIVHEDVAAELDCPAVILTEDGLCKSPEHTVCKYTSADKIMREVLDVYAGGKDGRLMRVTGSGARMWGIYSPVGRCGRTSFAAALAMRLARDGRTLLISFDEFSALPGIGPGEQTAGLSDIIYSYMKGGYSWSRLSRAVYSLGPADYVPPVRCPDDLDHISGEQLCELLLRISGESGYDNIVLDLGNIGRRAHDIPDICTGMYMPCPDDPLSDMKCRLYFEAMKAAGREDLRSRFERIVLPEPENGETVKKRPEDHMKGRLWEYVCRLAEDKTEAVDDDWADRWMV